MRLAAMFYLPMLACGFFVRPPGTLRVALWVPLAGWLAVAGGAGLVVVGLSRLAVRRTAWGKSLHEEFRAVLGTLDSREILILSLLSGFGEEMLFRGVLHAWLGLWPTALLFGAFHFPYRRGLIPWSLFALVLGVGLGYLTEGAGSLWPAILLHFLVNYLNLHDIAEAEAPPADAPRDGPGGSAENGQGRGSP